MEKWFWRVWWATFSLQILLLIGNILVLVATYYCNIF